MNCHSFDITLWFALVANFATQLNAIVSLFWFMLTDSKSFFYFDAENIQIH